MLIRLFVLIVIYGVGFVMSIPVKRVVDAWLTDVGSAGWVDFSALELGLIGLLPLAFLFRVWVHPSRIFLQGGDPADIIEKKAAPPAVRRKKKPPTIVYYDPRLRR